MRNISTRLARNLSLLAIALGIVITGALTYQPPAKGDRPRIDAVRVRFLQSQGIDITAPGVTVVLHPAATGGEMLAVTDVAALERAAPVAHFTRKRLREKPVELFGQPLPPKIHDEQAFVSFYRGQDRVAVVTCYSEYCDDKTSRRDIGPADFGGLLEAARPVQEISGSLQGTPEAIRKEYQALLDDPNVLFPQEQSAPSGEGFGGHSSVAMPVQFAPGGTSRLGEVAPLMQDTAGRLQAFLATRDFDAKVVAHIGYDFDVLAFPIIGSEGGQDGGALMVQGLRMGLLVFHDPEQRQRLAALAPEIEARFAQPEPGRDQLERMVLRAGGTVTGALSLGVASAGHEHPEDPFIFKLKDYWPTKHNIRYLRVQESP